MRRWAFSRGPRSPPPVAWTTCPWPRQTPQITRVWQAKSLVGLSPASIYADVFLFATSVIYHILKRNPIRAYGETVVVLVQTMIMVGLLWRYGGGDEVDPDDIEMVPGTGSPRYQRLPSGASWEGSDADASILARRKKAPPGGGLLGRTVIVLASLGASLACIQFLPEPLWWLLVVVSTPTLIAVQLPQIWKNFRQRHTGELATLTVFLAFLGSSIRIGTTIAVRDPAGAPPGARLREGLVRR